MTLPGYSPDFYRHYAQRNAQVADQFLQSVYTKSSHPGFTGGRDLWERLKHIKNGNRGPLRIFRSQVTGESYPRGRNSLISSANSTGL